MTVTSISRRDWWLRLAAFAAIYIIWGTTYFGISVAIRTIPPFISGGVRHVIAAFLAYLWVRMQGGNSFARLDWRAAAISGVLLSGLGNGLVIWAQQGIPTGVAALIITSVPVIVVVLDWLYFSRRAPSLRASMGTSLALLGVVTVILHTRSLAGAAAPIYFVSMVAAALAWSWGSLLQRRSVAGQSLLAFTCAQMFFGGVCQLLLATLDGEWVRLDVGAISLESLLAVAYLIVFGSIIAFTAYLWLLSRLPAAQVTTYALVNPVVALLIGAVVLHEAVTPLVGLAAIMVLVGVALVLFQNLTPRLIRWRRAPAAE